MKREGGVSRRQFMKSTAATGAAGLAMAAGAPVGDASPAKGKQRWGFLIDLRRCVGCKACAVACKTEFDVRLGYFRSSVKEAEIGSYPNVTRRFVPWLCNHCDNPVCISQCPVDEIDAQFTFPNGETVTYKKRATYKRPDGIVLVDQDRCIGCGMCVELCPYEVRYLDPAKRAGGDPDQNPADKCTLCAHRLDEGIVPSCVNTCQGRARIVGDLADSKSEISRLLKKHKTTVLMPKKGTKPQCFYVDLHHKAYASGRDTR